MKMKRLPSDFFKVPRQGSSVEIVSLLIAEPFMKDKWFGRSVIAIIDNNEREGTVGLVMNNPLATTLKDALPSITTEGVPLYSGGPVGHDRLLFIHSVGNDIIPGGAEISPGLWLGGNYESMVDYVNHGYPIEGHIRFFIGYSGWSSGQLYDELKSKTWALTINPLSPAESLTGEGDAYWHKVVAGLGDEFRAWNILPRDIRAN